MRSKLSHPRFPRHPVEVGRRRVEVVLALFSVIPFRPGEAEEGVVSIPQGQAEAALAARRAASSGMRLSTALARITVLLAPPARNRFVIPPARRPPARADSGRGRCVAAQPA